MAIYTKITKIFENAEMHIYEIANHSEGIDCVAVLLPSSKKIKIYKDDSLKELLYEYLVSDDPELKYKPYCDSPYSHLYGRGMHKLIYALNEGVFPQYLDKCS